MKTRIPPTAALSALRDLPLDEVDKRLAEIEAERAALRSLRRSLAARERAKRRSTPSQKQVTR